VTVGAGGAGTAQGGSGLVVIRYPSTFANATSTTGATLTVSGGYRIYQWLGDGSITI
jgi:hypothetical protein